MIECRCLALCVGVDHHELDAAPADLSIPEAMGVLDPGDGSRHVGDEPFVLRAEAIRPPVVGGGPLRAHGWRVSGCEDDCQSKQSSRLHISLQKTRTRRVSFGAGRNSMMPPTTAVGRKVRTPPMRTSVTHRRAAILYSCAVLAVA